MIYQITTVHVYLTYPFVLSWSMLEAMSCEAMVVGSDTQPVQEVIIDGQNGALVPFSDPNLLASKIISSLKNRNKLVSCRKEARKLILRKYELESCVAKQLMLIDSFS